MAASAATDRTGLQWRAVRRGDLEGGWPLRGEFRFRAPFYRAWRAAGPPAVRAAGKKPPASSLSSSPQAKPGHAAAPASSSTPPASPAVPDEMQKAAEKS